MITVDNLSKSYGEVEAVKSIDFELNDGEVVGFLGANGAGKSTTLKVITGYLSPTSGTVYVNGMNILENNYEIQTQVGPMDAVINIASAVAILGLVSSRTVTVTK